MLGAPQLRLSSSNFTPSDLFSTDLSYRDKNHRHQLQLSATGDGNSEKESDPSRFVEFRSPPDKNRLESDETEQLPEADSDDLVLTASVSQQLVQAGEALIEIRENSDAIALQSPSTPIESFSELAEDGLAGELQEFVSAKTVENTPRTETVDNPVPTTLPLSESSETRMPSDLAPQTMHHQNLQKIVDEQAATNQRSGLVSNEIVTKSSHVSTGALEASILTEDAHIAAQKGNGHATTELDPKEQVRDARSIGNRRIRSTRWFERSHSGHTNVDSRILKKAGPYQPDASSIHPPESDQINLSVGSSLLQQSISQSLAGSQSHPQAHSSLASTAPSGSKEWNEALATAISGMSPGTTGQQATLQTGEGIPQSIPPSISADTTATRSPDITGVERPISGQSAGHQSVQNSSTSEANSADSTARFRQTERIRLIQRVARSFTRLSADGGSVQLRLHPPELGSLSMHVRLEGRSMIAQMTTESAAAREVILESLPQLRNRLAQQGFEVTQITVDVADQSATGNHGDSRNPSSFGSHQDGHAGGRSTPTDLRRSAATRRQLDADRMTPTAFTNSATPGMRGIDLHA